LLQRRLACRQCGADRVTVLAKPFGEKLAKVCQGLHDGPVRNAAATQHLDQPTQVSQKGRDLFGLERRLQEVVVKAEVLGAGRTILGAEARIDLRERPLAGGQRMRNGLFAQRAEALNAVWVDLERLVAHMLGSSIIRRSIPAA